MAHTGSTQPSQADGEPSLHDTSRPITEGVDIASNSCETNPSTHQPKNTNLTLDNQVDFAAALPQKYLCRRCGTSYRDLLELKEHIKDHKCSEENWLAANQEKRPVVVNRRSVRSRASCRNKRSVEEVSAETMRNMDQLLRDGVSRLDVSRLLKIPIEKVKKVKSNASTISEGLENFILTFIREDRFFRISHLSQVVKRELDTSILDSTVRSLVIKNGYSTSGLQERRQLTDDVIKEQIAWANSHLKWTDQDWGKVMWTGEAGFRTYAHPDPDTPCNKTASRRLMWHLADEDPSDRAIRSSTTGKAGVRIWACMCTNGVGKFCRIEGPLDPVKYLRILQDYMLPSAWALIGPDFILHHDFDHAADDVSVQRWLRNPLPAEHIEVMVLPTHSNDVFNPIENFFNNLCFSLDGFESDDPDEFWIKIKETVESAPLSLCERLIHSMRARCASVVVAKGCPNRGTAVWN